jgi:hypothetical protein
LYTSKEDTSDVSFDGSLSVVSFGDGHTFTFVMKPMNKNIYTTSGYFLLLYFIYSYNHLQTSKASGLILLVTNQLIDCEYTKKHVNDFKCIWNTE